LKCTCDTVWRACVARIQAARATAAVLCSETTADRGEVVGGPSQREIRTHSLAPARRLLCSPESCTCSGSGLTRDKHQLLDRQATYPKRCLAIHGCSLLSGRSLPQCQSLTETESFQKDKAIAILTNLLAVYTRRKPIVDHDTRSLVCQCFCTLCCSVISVALSTVGQNWRFLVH
jgi:hypothetical protein